MKTLKFNPELVRLIKDGNKTTTWRLFDEKDIQKDDLLILIQRPELTPFAEAVVLDVNVKPLNELGSEDMEGHEDVGTKENMYQKYSSYYNRDVTPETQVKVIRFKIIKFL